MNVVREHNAVTIETPDARSNTTNGDGYTSTELEFPNTEGHMERAGLARRSLPSIFTCVHISRLRGSGSTTRWSGLEHRQS